MRSHAGASILAAGWSGQERHCVRLEGDVRRTAEFLDVVQFDLEMYALSALTSSTGKFSAVVLTSGLRVRVVDSRTVTSTAVTMLVRTPVIAWSFFHSRLLLT